MWKTGPCFFNFSSESNLKVTYAIYIMHQASICLFWSNVSLTHLKLLNLLLDRNCCTMSELVEGQQDNNRVKLMFLTCIYGAWPDFFEYFQNCFHEKPLFQVNFFIIRNDKAHDEDENCSCHIFYTIDSVPKWYLILVWNRIYADPCMLLRLCKYNETQTSTVFKHEYNIWLPCLPLWFWTKPSHLFETNCFIVDAFNLFLHSIFPLYI